MHCALEGLIDRMSLLLRGLTPVFPPSYIYRARRYFRRHWSTVNEPADDMAGPRLPNDGAAVGADEGTSDGLLTTGDMARLSGSTLRTVRFYEEAGLLCPVERSDGGHRMFHPRELSKLRLVLDLREVGLSLGEIKQLFSLKRGCGTPEQASKDMSAILENQVEMLQRKITILRRVREELVSMMAVISECRSCQDDRFPHRCHECDVLKRPDLPRAVRLLWRT